MSLKLIEIKLVVWIVEVLLGSMELLKIYYNNMKDKLYKKLFKYNWKESELDSIDNFFNKEIININK